MYVQYIAARLPIDWTNDLLLHGNTEDVDLHSNSY